MVFKYLDKVKIIQKALVVNGDGKILVMKRSLDDVYRPGAWDLPGGNIDEDDRNNYQSGMNIALVSIEREIKEEANLEVYELRPIYTEGRINDLSGKGVLLYILGYQAKTDFDKVILSPEHIEYKWVDRQEYLGLDFGNGGEFLKKMVENVKI